MQSDSPKSSPLKLVLMGDCCSGVPGHPHETNLRSVTEALRHTSPTADALCFLGDHVAGYVAEEPELRAQWAWFFGQEFPAIEALVPRVFHVAGNHDCYDEISRSMCEEMLTPSDGAELIARKDLNYAVKLKQALLIFLNTADHRDRGTASLDLGWLTQVLHTNTEAPLKLVFGHHPIQPVNGYVDWPLWRLNPEVGAAAWSLMRSNGVAAYMCSHIIAFDFQVKDGLPQLCSGGAGTEYGPHGAMPGPIEYQHFVLLEADSERFSFQAIDQERAVREALSWPIHLAAPTERLTLVSSQSVRSQALAGLNDVRRLKALSWHIKADATNPLHQRFEIVGGMGQATAPTCSLACEFQTGSTSLRVRNQETDTMLEWHGPSLHPNDGFLMDIVVFPHAGPGGVLMRLEDGPWSSMDTLGASGLDDLTWPTVWELRGELQHPVVMGVHLH